MDLYQHQKEGVDFICKNGGGFLAYAMGLGKTRIVLEAFKEWHPKGFKLLVVCPLSLINTAWRDDIKKFAPELRFCDLHGKKRFDADVYAVNYEAFISKGRIEEIANLATDNKIVACLDESSRISNPRAKSAKNLMSMRTLFGVRIAMSGTPCSQDDTQWYNQINFVRDGIFHPSFFAFKNTYFHLQRGKYTLPLAQGGSKEVYQQLFSKGWKVGITESKRTQLINTIRPIVLWRNIDDCLDLPEEIDEVREVEMHDEQARAYKEMKTQCITEIREQAIVAPLALTKLLKLRQITSGMAITPDGEVMRMDGNPKLNELQDVLEELGNEQAIIFVNFKAEVADIKSVYGDSCVVIDGDTADKATEINAFKAGEKRLLIANIQSMAHGVTLVNARYVIYYSHSYSAEKFAQSRARIRRIGQTKSCVYIHLQCKDTIDGIIYDVLKRKADATEIVARMLQ